MCTFVNDASFMCESTCMFEHARVVGVYKRVFERDLHGYNPENKCVNLSHT